MSDRIYYRKTNFSNKKFSEIFEGDLLGNIVEKNNHVVSQFKKIETIKEECVNSFDKQLSKMRKDANKKILLNYAHDFYNDKGELEKKFGKIFFLLDVSLAKTMVLFFNLKSEIKVLEDELHNYAVKRIAFEKKNITDNLKDNPDFIQNVKMTDCFLYEKMKCFYDSSVKNYRKKQRKLENFLYNYYARLSVKTSPFGFLGTTGICNENFEIPRNIFMSVNTGIILRLVDKIYADTECQEYLSYKLNETQIRKDGKYFITVFDNIDGKPLYKNRQKLVTISENEILEDFFANFSVNRNYKGNSIIDFLSHKNGKQIFNLLVENQILLPDLNIRILKGQTLTESLQNYFKNFKAQCFNKYLAFINKMVELENEIFSWDKYDKLVSTVCECVNFFDIRGFDKSNCVQIDKVASCENKYADHLGCILSEKAHYLELFSEFISIFDISTRNKYLAYEILKSSYGGTFVPESSEDIALFLRHLASVLFNRDGYWLEAFGYLKEEYKLHIDKNLADLKKTVVRNLLSQSLVNENQVMIEKNLFNDSVSRLNNIVGKTHCSRDYFVQIGENSEIILNHAYKGYGVYRRRFNHYFPDENKEYGLEGELIDIPSIFGFNANIRESTNRTLTLPLGDNCLSSKESLSWLDIGFRISEVSKEIEIFEKSTNKVIYPHFLGSLITMAIPSLVAIFNSISLNDSIFFDFGDLILRERLKEKVEKIIVIPRVCFLDSEIVISRKKWYINCAEIKEIVESDLPIEIKLIKIFKYFQNEKLPISFFIKSFFEDYDEDSELLKSKPLYVNFQSLLSFKAFISAVSEKEKILIEEVAPGCINKENDTVVEMILETAD